MTKYIVIILLVRTKCKTYTACICYIKMLYLILHIINIQDSIHYHSINEICISAPTIITWELLMLRVHSYNNDVCGTDNHRIEYEVKC